MSNDAGATIIAHGLVTNEDPFLAGMLPVGGFFTDGAVYATGPTTITSTLAMQDGQVLIGDSTGAPQLNTITPGPGITVTNGHHSITIASSGGSVTDVVVPLTSANITGMYAAPVQVVAAPGLGKAIIPLSVVGNFIYGSVQYTGGGDIGLQWNNTIHAGGVGAMNGAVLFQTDVQAAVNGWAVAAEGFGANSHGASSGIVNTALYVSNAGAAFAGGGDGTATLTIRYLTVNMV